MGKTKQERKFDRNVEISAPYLDPEIIRQIHSPPKDQKRDIRHGGFKALLSDLNSQDSADELSPITENHLPSYIGISCAVSGYSNYSSYVRKPSDETRTHDNSAISSTRLAKNRSQTNSPFATKLDQQEIHHVTIDKTHISSPDQERRELTEKLTASVAERRRSPSPLPPPEDERHHGAYVGARYFPMPEPSKLVHKHIPLLGIDDDVDPDTVVVEDANKVEKKIASLYGDEFVEDWKESMSHKARKEHDEFPEKMQETKQLNLKEIVTLKPTPPKGPQLDEPKQIDVPTPNVKVLASVEKQFLNRLLTDENPPMPKPPTPQPTSPTSPKSSRESKTQSQQIEPELREPELLQLHQQPEPEPTPEPQPQSEPQLQHELKSEPTPEPEPISLGNSTSLLPEPIADVLDGAHKLDTNSPDYFNQDYSASDTKHDQSSLSRDTPVTLEGTMDENQPVLLDLTGGNEELQVHHEVAVENLLGDESLSVAPVDDPQIVDKNDYIEHRSRSSSASSRDEVRSPESQKSSSTVERVPLDKQQQQQHEFEAHEDHIEYEVRAESPQVNNESSPVRVLESTNDISPLISLENSDCQKAGDLVSFSPEPGAELMSETNNNFEEQMVQSDGCTKSPGEDVSECVVENEDSETVQGEAEVSTGLEPENERVSGGDNEVKDGHHFLDLLRKEESFIMEQVRNAEQLLAEHQNEMDEERLGRIHSAIGKANLLINKKCNQFRELCEKSMNGDANDQYAVLNDDLAGFWDMISIQIADVRKSFENP